MSAITGDVIDVLVKLGLIGTNDSGGVKALAALPLDENGNIVANVNLRTGLLGAVGGSGLLSYAGGAGEVGVATDVNALVRYTGVAGEAKAFRRSKFVGRTQVQLLEFAAGAANAWNQILFTNASAIVDDLGALSVGTNSIIVPAGVDYFDLHINFPLVETTGATGKVRKLRVIKDGVVTGVAANRYVVAGYSDTAVIDLVSGCVPFDIKHIIKSAVAQPLTFQFNHDSSVPPSVGLSLNMMLVTVDMFSDK